MGRQRSGGNGIVDSKTAIFANYRTTLTNPLTSPEDRFGWRADGFKPAADIHLRVRFATEMPGRWTHGGGQIPLDDRELLISTLDHIPMDRILTDNPANLALKFFQTRHGFSGGKDSFQTRGLRRLF
jgi:hypothetical protein